MAVGGFAARVLACVARDGRRYIVPRSAIDAADRVEDSIVRERNFSTSLNQEEKEEESGVESSRLSGGRGDVEDVGVDPNVRAHSKLRKFVSSIID